MRLNIIAMCFLNACEVTRQVSPLRPISGCSALIIVNILLMAHDRDIKEMGVL